MTLFILEKIFVLTYRLIQNKKIKEETMLLTIRIFFLGLFLFSSSLALAAEGKTVLY